MYALIQSTFRVQIAEITERRGFEPPVSFKTSDFKSDAIDHSATSPVKLSVNNTDKSYYISSSMQAAPQEWVSGKEFAQIQP